jgi:hypothetical protein
MHKPQARDYHTNDGMHAAMRKWARTQMKKQLAVTVVFNDGSELTDLFERITRGEPYRTPDGELYEEPVDTALYWSQHLPGPDELTQAQVKEAYAKWLGPGVKSITWKLVPPYTPVIAKEPGHAAP